MDRFELVVPIALIGKRSQCCFLSWHDSQVLSFWPLNFGKPSTICFDCMSWSFGKLMWPNRLCHNSMSDSTFYLLVYIVVPTSLVSSMNICPSLRPRAITWSLFSMKHLFWLNRICMPWLIIFLSNTKFLVIVYTWKAFFNILSGISDVIDCVDGVVIGLHKPRLLRLLLSHEPFFMVLHMVRSSWVDDPHISLCWVVCFHWIGVILHEQHGVTFRSSRVTDVVWLLLVDGFGFARIHLLFPTLVFLVTLLAIVPTINQFVLMDPSINLTPPYCGGSSTPIGPCILPLSIWAIMGASRPTSPTTSMGPICLYVQHLVVRGRTACHPCMVFFDHQHPLQVEEWGWLLSHAYSHSELSELLC